MIFFFRQANTKICITIIVLQFFCIIFAKINGGKIRTFAAKFI